MRIIDNDRMAETWNSAFRDHSIASAECQVPDIQILKESKWGGLLENYTALYQM